MAESPTIVVPCPERLAQARNALHAILTGAQEVEVSYGDRTIKYRASSGEDIARLRAYIAELTAECGGANGTPGIAARTNFRMVF